MRHRGVSTWLWRSSYPINMSVPRGLRSMRIEHNNVNPVGRIKLEIANCQTVVGSFSFLQEEYLVRPQVCMSAGASVVDPIPIIVLSIFSGIITDSIHVAVTILVIMDAIIIVIFVYAIWNTVVVPVLCIPF